MIHLMWSPAQLAIAGLLGFAALRVLKIVRAKRARKLLPARLCVVVTGSTHGLGLSLVRAFLQLSNNNNIRVVVNGRKAADVDLVVKKLQQEFPALVAADPQVVSGFAADVCNYESVQQLAVFAKSTMGAITHWINNAGVSQSSRQLLVDTPVEELATVLATNTLGTLYGTRAALHIMQEQRFGHIFNMEGNGSRQNSTPMSIAYGFSKGGFRQLNKSLVAETRGRGVGCHLISPGMIITRLLVSHASHPHARIAFNLLADTGATVAGFLAPRVLATFGTGTRIDYLTPWGVVWRVLTFWRFRGRFFDPSGRCLVAYE
eukprot:m.234370 g.234370  ORF g.234370 m.234370 type:complete len:318 (+) comp19572_c0_seq1:147-1100(+)